ncbi:MAG: methyltransferase domain-containing protein [Rhizobiaceae bacterium]|nr:methyltransferase domain-containing protein [Rhizobiaceae bacterium]
MPSSARFWDRIAKRYSRQPVSDEASYQKKLQITRDLFRPDMKLLEFGCGTGSTALVHAPHVNHIHAIDISAKMIEIAKDKAAKANVSNVTFEQATLETLRPQDEDFDMILGLSILHLVEDRDAAIRRVVELLKPGGYFISSTACLGDNMKIFKLIAPIGGWLGLLPVLRVFSTKQLVTSLENAGLEIEQRWSPGKNKGVFIVARKPS